MSEVDNSHLEVDGVEATKSKNQLKNEAKRAEKLKKFEEKVAKVGDLAEKAKPKKTLTSALAPSASSEAIPVTPEGEKKDMSQPMASAYSPSHVEAAWYAWWESSGFFSPEYRPAWIPESMKREPFTMVLPPPNVTGSLHVGHAMMGSIEDALSRWHRMCGREVLFLPGCDHAGIATQAVVEKKLKKERGLTRHDLGREDFLKEVWAYKDQYGDRIYQQLRRMGASLDWPRARFTLDEMSNKAVTEAFVRMFEDGLIFRANRLVNWSGKLQTALSDLEVDSIEVEPNSWHSVTGHKKAKYEFGVMTSFSYKAEDESLGEIVISTTRPETLFADTAVAVHPTDARYASFHGGKRVIHPVTGRPLPVILDEVADPAFGTGALKISPAHDHIDFGVGQRHGLESISILDANNLLNDRCMHFAGMARYDAREAVIEFCKANGTFRGQTPHAMSLPVCSRSGDFVEPRLMPQWWCRCGGMAAQAVEAVKDGRIRIAPKEHERVWYNWLENIHDWCLSRQLWWGHRIPAYRVILANESASETWLAARSEAEALEKAKAKFPGVEVEGVEQDPDVLDTWFSSGLWPFSTLGWPEADSADFARFFPTTLLETGGDILFFWVARMVMMSMYLTGKVPFTQVFLHAIIRDAHGRKMSKSLGNVIDPIDVIQGITLAELQATLERGNLDHAEVVRAKEGQKKDFPAGIPECGTDALRFALCSYVAHGRDVNLSINKVEAYRKFCNKLWNACKFALVKLGSDFVPSREFVLSGTEGASDRWILMRLNETAAQTNAAFTEYNLMNATGAVHQFWLYDLCDVYIEAVKPILSSTEEADRAKRAAAQQVLYRCLEEGLKLLHPFMPFVTEELYQRLPARNNPLNAPSVCVAQYPHAQEIYSRESLGDSSIAEFERVLELARAIRSLAADEKAPKNAVIRVCGEGELLHSHAAQMAALVRAVGSLSLEAASEQGAVPLAGFDGVSVAFSAPA